MIDWHFLPTLRSNSTWRIPIMPVLLRDDKKARFGRELCLRFVAAVSVSCSGDKSDKEESAGRFAILWGFCVTAAVVDWQSVRLNDDSQRKYVDFPEMT